MPYNDTKVRFSMANKNFEKEKQIINKIDNEPGYWLHEGLKSTEYMEAKRRISKQWEDVINQYDKKIGEIIKSKDLKIEDYGDIERHLCHEKIWTKQNRILNQDFYWWLSSTCFYKNLENIFGAFVISDEEKLGRPNIYWRLVRPGNSKDVGPLHRDSWFWELNSDFGMNMNKKKRTKAWIDIHTEQGLNGLLVEPNSHKRTDIVFKGERRDGIEKPKPIPMEKVRGLKMPLTHKGNCILFNDDLIHGGSLNKGSKARVSFEFTIISDKTFK